MEDVQEKFKTIPIKLDEDRVIISLDKLNEELAPYEMHVDSLDDIFIEPELSEINKATVIKIHAIDTSPDDDMNIELFFDKSLENKFKAIEFIYSAEVDKGELTILLTLNAKDLKLEKKLERGGQVNPNAEIEQQVDKQLKENPTEVFKLLGLEPPKNEQEMKTAFATARQRAIEHYVKNKPKLVTAFFEGRKINMAGGGANQQGLYLQNRLANLIYDEYKTRKGGSFQDAQEDEYAKHFAKNKSQLCMDNIYAMASQSTEPVLHLTADTINQLVKGVFLG